MKNIAKNSEKEANSLLSAWRSTPGAEYDSIDKKPMRRLLLREQGYLCCYCMKRIYEDTSHIEHWRPRKKHPEEQFNYRNLLLSCSGDSPSGGKSCGHRKGNEILKYNPADPEHNVERGITYDRDGRIRYSRVPEFETQLTSLLNLNDPILMGNRRRVRDSVCARLGKEAGTASKSMVNKLLAAWKNIDANGMYQEYCHVAIQYLEKKAHSV